MGKEDQKIIETGIMTAQSKYMSFTLGLAPAFIAARTQTFRPSWQDGDIKSSIINRIQKITNSHSSNIIPLSNRIARFDNDGTLWAEQLFLQGLFAIYQVKKIVKKNSLLAEKPPFKAVIETDKTYFTPGGEKATLQLHPGSEENFEPAVKDFLFNTHLVR